MKIIFFFFFPDLDSVFQKKAIILSRGSEYDPGWSLVPGEIGLACSFQLCLRNGSIRLQHRQKAWLLWSSNHFLKVDLVSNIVPWVLVGMGLGEPEL